MSEVQPTGSIDSQTARPSTAGGNPPPPEAGWLAALQHTYKEIPVKELTSAQVSHIKQRWQEREGRQQRWLGRSWQVTFALTSVFFLILAILPILPQLTLPNSNEVQAPMANALRSEATDTGSALSFQASTPPTPQPEPAAKSPDDGAEEPRSYASVTVAQVHPEQLVTLRESGKTMVALNGSLFLARNEGGSSNPIDLPSVDKVIVLHGSFLGTLGMPVGQDLLILTDQEFLPENAASLAWDVFLAQAWPWSLLFLLASLVFLFLFSRSPRGPWIALFLACLFLALLWPFLSPPSSSHWLMLSSSETTSIPWDLSLQPEKKINLPENTTPVMGNPFRLPLGEDSTLVLADRLSAAGLQEVGKGISGTAEVSESWLFLPAGLAFPLQLFLIGLRALCFLLPLLLLVWLNHMGTREERLKAQDRLP